MQVKTVVHENRIAYAVLLVLFSFVITYQVRSSLETVHFETHLDFYVPFLLDPFTNRIGACDHFASWDAGRQYDVEPHSVLKAGDELLAINGQPFRGMAMYLQELRKAEYQPHPLPTDFQRYPFVLTIRSGNSETRHVEIAFPHCTCGRFTAFEAAVIWVVPAIFCVLLGFATACVRPRALLAWAFLGLMLSLSQLRLWPEWYLGFQQTSTPMVWNGWYRVPAVLYQGFVQHSWPAAFLAGAMAVYGPRRVPYRIATIAVTVLLIYAGLRAALQLSWSEGYRLAILQKALEHYETELLLSAFIGFAILAWLVNRMLGIAVTAASLLAATALYTPAFAITGGEWYTYSDSTRRFVASIPSFHTTPAFVVVLFAAICLLAAAVTFRRELTTVDLAGLLLCVPPVIHVAGFLGAYWYLYGPWSSDYWLKAILVLSASGLLCVSWSVVRRSARVAA